MRFVSFSRALSSISACCRGGLNANLTTPKAYVNALKVLT